MKKVLVMFMVGVSISFVGCIDDSKGNSLELKEVSYSNKENRIEDFKIEFNEGNLYGYTEEVILDYILINTHLVLLKDIDKEDLVNFRLEYLIKFNGEEYVKSDYIKKEKLDKYDIYIFKINKNGDIKRVKDIKERDIFTFYENGKAIYKVKEDVKEKIYKNFKGIEEEFSINKNSVSLNYLKGSNKKYFLLKVSNIYGMQYVIINKEKDKAYYSEYIKYSFPKDKLNLEEEIFIDKDSIYKIDGKGSLYKTDINFKNQFEKVKDLNEYILGVVESEENIYLVNNKYEIKKFKEENLELLKSYSKGLRADERFDLFIYENSNEIYIGKPKGNKIEVISKIYLKDNESILSISDNKVVIKEYDVRKGKVIYKFYKI
ncbi:hypothetical protein M4I33_12435 [Clostridium sp. LY3-2]|uniref:hypothetical protein n=1 Tax=Clostridium sp. LY3-2 TaxID=2942482 RepID=UPI0021530B96|nr:hypothetical protein [Clostridium sp. LY3-2]MCR6515676.1 hypothetical protein [Clostridium sp. LY3-2]